MRVIPLLVFLLVMADSSFAMNKKMVMTIGDDLSSLAAKSSIPVRRMENEKLEMKENEKLEVKENSLDTNLEPNLNNHHSIPRQSFGGYVNNQDGHP
ncbi:hypothetical protein JCGZ_16574 [Jatropha curcas]|uniref:Uncharacterized protein n=1 Tax=Jatropha curcas TaxID=180498 RepID=A0A067KA74_JATCU|nr:hypothetical protein JCGZ_16574 [Jatropha curcas]